MSWYSNNFSSAPKEGYFQYESHIGLNLGSIWIIYTKNGEQIGHSASKLYGLPVVIEQELSSQRIWTARLEDGKFLEGLPRGQKYVGIKEK